MINRISQIYADRQVRLNSERQFNDNASSLHSVSKESIPDDAQNERTVVEVATTEGSPDFGPRERHGFFGLLHSTVNNRFKRIMLVGVANVLLILSFLLFMLFFVLKIKCAKPEVIYETIQCPTTPVHLTTSVATTQNPGNKYYCPDGFTLVQFGFTRICWKMFPDFLDRDSAAKACNTDNGAILFGVHSEEQNQQFIDFMTIKDHSCWFGLRCTNGNQGNCSFDNGLHAPFAYTAFADGSPTASTECLYYDTPNSKTWISDDCGTQRPFVCELVPDIRKINMACEYSHNNFYACRNQCGNLPSVEDEEENQYLASILEADSSIYLGALFSVNNIVWVDGTTVGYRNLRSHNAKESCIMMESDGQWRTSQCGVVSSFICKIPFDANC
ncbi:unnamed protein product [Caenorhabditis brenneri]